jgi:hypothetical protein
MLFMWPVVFSRPLLISSESGGFGRPRSVTGTLAVARGISYQWWSSDSRFTRVLGDCVILPAFIEVFRGGLSDPERIITCLYYSVGGVMPIMYARASESEIKCMGDSCVFVM